MDSTLWFDRLGRFGVRGAARRELAYAAGAAFAGRLLSAAPAAPAAPADRRQRRDVCDRAFATREDRRYCRFIRPQRDGADPREFCIVEGDPFDPAKVAVCCAEGAICCGAACCGGPGDPRRCCRGACLDVRGDEINCGACGNDCRGDQYCAEGECICPQVEWVFNALCGYCLPPDYDGRAAAGPHCPGTHVCRRHPSGAWLCDARSAG